MRDVAISYVSSSMGQCKIVIIIFIIVMNEADASSSLLTIQLLPNK